jgi:hypothetical protein
MDLLWWMCRHRSIFWRTALMPDWLNAATSIPVKTRDDLAEHRLFLMRMGVPTKEIDKRLDRIRKKRTGRERGSGAESQMKKLKSIAD